MNHNWYFFLGIIIAELTIVPLIFLLISKSFKSEFRIISVIKGALERLFILISLINNLPQSLILFGALKVATSIKNSNKNSPDYYFLGNIVSVLIAIIYFTIQGHIFQ